jgi:hypothetical protein
MQLDVYLRTLFQDAQVARVDLREELAFVRRPRLSPQQRLPRRRRRGGQREPHRLADGQPGDEVRLRVAKVVLVAVNEPGQEVGGKCRAGKQALCCR